jgi:hypothetical protein
MSQHSKIVMLPTMDGTNNRRTCCTIHHVTSRHLSSLKSRQHRTTSCRKALHFWLLRTLCIDLLLASSSFVCGFFTRNPLSFISSFHKSHIFSASGLVKMTSSSGQSTVAAVPKVNVNQCRKTIRMMPIIFYSITRARYRTERG